MGAQPTLTKAIKARMAELGWTQAKLAKEANVSRRQIIRILKGQARPKMSTLVRILGALEMPDALIEQAEWIEQDKDLTGLFLLVLQDPQRTGERVRKLLLDRNLTPAALAKATGLSLGTIQNFILGSGVSPANLVRLAMALDVQPRELMRWSPRGEEILLALRKGAGKDPELRKRVTVLMNLLRM